MLFIAWHAQTKQHAFSFRTDTSICDGGTFVQQSISFSPLLGGEESFHVQGRSSFCIKNGGNAGGFSEGTASTTRLMHEDLAIFNARRRHHRWRADCWYVRGAKNILAASILHPLVRRVDRALPQPFKTGRKPGSKPKTTKEIRPCDA
ncbi:MAG: hypothetical protein HY273_08340 [Gammaproteobacteria bacterium]|nr:hypothetical protein [Gammaproteobacteria bacterium]